jgi:RNA polymerase sigma-70 factor (ECF subfamily)
VHTLTAGLRDEAPIERLYREQRDRLWRALLAYSRDPELAADAVAEAFAQLLHRGEAVRDPLRWVWSASFRLAAGELKARRNRGQLREETYSMPDPPIDLLQALAQLAPKQRAAVILHHYAGYPTRDVAAILGSTPPAVRVHLTVGRRRLRELLSRGAEDA